jgi:hypothetical protein
MNSFMSVYINQTFENLQEVASANCQRYCDADPFPSISFENFFDVDSLGKVLAEFPDLENEDSIRFQNSKEKKFAGKGEQSFGVETRRFMHFLNSQPFLEFLQTLTGIDEALLGDPYYYGGGLHEIKRGGLLKVHADFNKHDKTGLDRRINVLVYLNKDWKKEYGGHFELWDRKMKGCKHRVLPMFNTLAIFTTTDFSFHGHPDPLECPSTMSRKSLALYYYSNGRPKSEIDENQEQHGTLFRARTGDSDDSEVFRSSSGAKVKRFIREVTPPIIFNEIRRLRSGK